MSTHLQGFQSFYRFPASFCIGKLATSNVRVKAYTYEQQLDFLIPCSLASLKPVLSCPIDHKFDQPQPPILDTQTYGWDDIDFLIPSMDTQF